MKYLWREYTNPWTRLQCIHTIFYERISYHDYISSGSDEFLLSSKIHPTQRLSTFPRKLPFNKFGQQFRLAPPLQSSAVRACSKNARRIYQTFIKYIYQLYRERYLRVHTLLSNGIPPFSRICVLRISPIGPKSERCSVARIMWCLG